MEIKTKAEWKSLGQSNKKSYIFYEGYCLDLTNFMQKHPGGADAIQPYLFQDADEIIFEIFPHNPLLTPKVLKQYRIGKVSQQRPMKTGTILKSKRLNNNSNEKQEKVVKFPSEVQSLASEKQRKQTEKLKKNPKRSKKSKKPMSKQKARRIEELNKKFINPTYEAVLKGKVIVQKQSVEKSPTKEKSKGKCQLQTSKGRNRMETSLGFILKKNNIQENDPIREQSLKVLDVKSANSDPLDSADILLSVTEEEGPNIRVPVMQVNFFKF